MNFDELRSAVSGAQETLAKSLAAPANVTLDNKNIAAAAADGAAAGGATAAANAAAAEENPDETDPLTKSFSLTLDDGTVLEGFDGTELMKSFAARLNKESETREGDVGELMKAVGATLGMVTTMTDALAKATQTITDQGAQLVELKKDNGELRKSLAAFGNEGRGRRSVDVTVHGKTPAGGADAPVERRPAEILAKAVSAMSAGRISGMEASQIEAAINAGMKPDQSLVERIFSQ